MLPVAAVGVGRCRARVRRLRRRRHRPGRLDDLLRRLVPRGRAAPRLDGGRRDLPGHRDRDGRPGPGARARTRQRDREPGLGRQRQHGWASRPWPQHHRRPRRTRRAARGRRRGIPDRGARSRRRHACPALWLRRHEPPLEANRGGGPGARAPAVRRLVRLCRPALRTRGGHAGRSALPMSLLSVRDLVVRFRTEDGPVYAVNGVDLDLAEGETLGLVGESGSGKSVTSLAIIGLLPRPGGRVERGQVLFEGTDLTKLSEAALRRLRGKEIAMVFQDPMTSLNPVLSIEEQVVETITAHRRVRPEDARARAVELLDLVGIPRPQEQLRRYPHQFSGGMRQRVMIAIALALQPKLLIADEPTTALDVTVQAQILELIQKLTAESGTAVILISHDLGVVARTTQHVAVMYAGFVVESAGTSERCAPSTASRSPSTAGRPSASSASPGAGSRRSDARSCGSTGPRPVWCSSRGRTSPTPAARSFAGFGGGSR